MYVLVLPKHLGEELTRHGLGFRVQIPSSFSVQAPVMARADKLSGPQIRQQVTKAA
jgi:hypothetical protein